VAKCSSSSVSETTSRPSSVQIVRAQNETSRGTSELSSPTSALPHWRSASTKFMTAIGVRQIADASWTTSSYSCSVSVSRISSSRSARRRSASLAGTGNGMVTRVIGLAHRRLNGAPAPVTTPRRPVAFLAWRRASVRSSSRPRRRGPLSPPDRREARQAGRARRAPVVRAGRDALRPGRRDAPFFVIERGLVDFVDRRPGEEVWFSQADSRTFIGDIAMFTGEPTIAACIAAEPTDVIAFDRAGLRAMLAEWPEFGEIVLRTMTARRAWLEGHGHGVLRLIAPRGSRRAFEVRDLLERNLLPVRWYDVDTDSESAALLDTLSIPRAETPVLVRNDGVLRNPSPAQVARELGLRAEVDGQRFDLVVSARPGRAGRRRLRRIRGPAHARLRGVGAGGQAGTSTRIENYLGFPTGISGTELTRKATLQARRFDAVLSSFHRAVELVDGPEGLVRVDLDDGQHVLARTVVLATGARWRTLQAEGVSRFEQAGVYHAAMATDAERCRGEDVIVVGGGNSAGQAAVHLSRMARSVRSSCAATASPRRCRTTSSTASSARRASRSSRRPRSPPSTATARSTRSRCATGPRAASSACPPPPCS
jgi:hypothetical protein